MIDLGYLSVYITIRQIFPEYAINRTDTLPEVNRTRVPEASLGETPSEPHPRQGRNRL